MVNQRVLVTGSRGNLGQDLVARLSLFDSFTVLQTTSETLNLTWDKDDIREVLNQLQPDIIVNCAAFTQVDTCESEYDKALKINAEAPETLAEWVSDHSAYFIHISTDYVFDGKRGQPYTPEDLSSPVNRYGLSKLAGEQAVFKVLAHNAAVVRTSWLYGAGAKNFVPFVIRSLQEETVINVAHDQWGTPTWTGVLCKMLLTVMEERMEGIFHGCCQGQTSRYHQACFIARALGVSEEFVRPVSTDSFAFPAKRPVNTAMVPSFENVVSWEEALQRFLQTQGLVGSYV